MKHLRILILLFVMFTIIQISAMRYLDFSVDNYIFDAVQNGDTETLLYFDVLIKKCDFRDSKGNNLFDVAIYHRQYIAARLLTAIKPKLNEQKPQGITLYDLIRPS